MWPAVRLGSHMTAPIDEPPGSNARQVLTNPVSLGRMDTELYEPLRSRMRACGLRARALKVGDFAPDFFLPDDQARLVSLRDLLQSGPVVLAFIAGSWCSFCTSKVRVLGSALDGHGATFVVATPETGRHPTQMKTEHGLSAIVLSDVDYAVGRLFGVAYAVPPTILARMAAKGLDLGPRHGVSAPMLPAPSLFVISTAQLITWSTVEMDYTRSTNPEAVLGALHRASA